MRYGGKLLGICGGFQMLGRVIEDPEGRDGPPGSSEGLGLLDFTTRMGAAKQLRNVSGRLLASGAALAGYEIHHGVSEGPALARPLCELDGHPDGAVSEDGQVLGTYLHGLFDQAEACAALLALCGLEGEGDTPGDTPDYAAHRQRDLDRLADSLEEHLDIAAIEVLISR